MDALLTVLAFFLMTMPIALALVMMQSSGANAPQRPAPYQPMEILMARQRAQQKAAGSGSHDLAA